jgi:ferredoxin
MRVTADRDRCISAGRCMATAPDVFDQDDDGIVLVMRPELGAADQDVVTEAVFQCPARALEVSQ